MSMHCPLQACLSLSSFPPPQRVTWLKHKSTCTSCKCRRCGILASNESCPAWCVCIHHGASAVMNADTPGGAGSMSSKKHALSVHACCLHRSGKSASVGARMICSAMPDSMHPIRCARPYVASASPRAIQERCLRAKVGAL